VSIIREAPNIAYFTDYQQGRKVPYPWHAGQKQCGWIGSDPVFDLFLGVVDLLFQGL
jgi:hypothetical protein